MFVFFSRLYSSVDDIFCSLFMIPGFQTVEVMLNEAAVLQCNVNIPSDMDKVTLVIWYKNGSSLPIYRLVHKFSFVRGPLIFFLRLS